MTCKEKTGYSGALSSKWGDSATDATAITGSLDLTDNNVKVGSLNFEGGWDTTTNRMYELVVHNAVITQRVSIRNYFADRYGMAV